MTTQESIANITEQRWPEIMPECWCCQELKKRDLIELGREWLAKNPMPQYWLGGVWCWVHAEMPGNF